MERPNEHNARGGLEGTQRAYIVALGLFGPQVVVLAGEYAPF